MSHFRGDVAFLIAGVLCRSMANNNLTNGGTDMTGVAAIAEALKVNTTLQSVKYAIQFTAL